MKALVFILMSLATGCHAQDPNGITTKVFEKGADTDKAMELMEEAQRKIQAAEKEITDGKK